MSTRRQPFNQNINVLAEIASPIMPNPLEEAIESLTDYARDMLGHDLIHYRWEKDQYQQGKISEQAYRKAEEALMNAMLKFKDETKKPLRKYF
jgi:hypothetical protein